MTVEDILKALSHVDDPDLRRDIVSLNMVKNLKIDGDTVSFDVELTTPACPMKEAIKKACINAVHHMVSKTADVQVNMTARVTTQRNSEILPGVKNIIAVASGKGGVGKSTVSVNLALALKSYGASVGLLDADVHGPSIPSMTGIGYLPESPTGNIEPAVLDGIKFLSIGFMIDPAQPVVWRGPMVASALKQLLTDANWGNLDYLIIDLPPGTGDTQLSLVQHVKLSGVIMVTTPQKVALSDCRRALGMFKMPQINVPVLGVVENMSWFEPKEFPGNRYHLFGKDGGITLAREFDLPLLAQIPMYASVMENADEGKAISNAPESEAFDHFMRLAGEVARQMAIKNAALAVN